MRGKNGMFLVQSKCELMVVEVIGVASQVTTKNLTAMMMSIRVSILILSLSMLASQSTSSSFYNIK